MLHLRPALLIALLAVPTQGQRVLATVYGQVSEGRLGTVVRAAGDVDGDGTGDFVVTAPSNGGAGAAHLISGATRAILATFHGSPGAGMFGLGATSASPVGDVDGDGRTDFAFGYVNRGALDVFSGASGARLYRLGPAIEFLQAACPVGDLDGDGRGDFVAYVQVNSVTQLWAIRGVDGSMIRAVSTQTSSDGPILEVGDLTGDGQTEVAVCGTWLEIYDPRPARRLVRVRTPLLSVVDAEVADWDGDGSADVLMSARAGSHQPFVFVMSAATGALLASLALPPGDGWQPGGHFAVLPDVDADGRPDLVVAGGSDPLGADTAGAMLVLSGANGRRLGAWPGTAGFGVGGQPVASLGDVDADGVGDYVVGNPGVAAGRGGWQLISGRTLAAMLVKPVNCYSGPFAPSLGITRPVLGRTMTVAGRDAPPGSPCVVGLSLRALSPTSLGVAGCDVWLDAAGWIDLGYPAGGPSWQFGVALPNHRALTGLEIALQALYLGTATPIGADLTNGIWARLGS
jgi:hypothetical protein